MRVVDFTVKLFLALAHPRHKKNKTRLQESSYLTRNSDIKLGEYLVSRGLIR